ncbi:MAG: transcriptional repressor NrdR [Nanoarchaeales archaeon]|nr:transcriptional repressor NrdR [Nanoarchaeales archaeon]
MKCPYCDHTDTRVSDSRESKDQTSIKRRRECQNCEKRFSTYEKVLKLDLEVRKSNGQIEEFNIQKIKRSLLKACEKRPITLEQIENVLDGVLKDLKKVKEDHIPTDAIGKFVLKNIKDLDEIAFLKYAIVHNNYSSMNDFMKEIDKIKDFKGITYRRKPQKKCD